MSEISLEMVTPLNGAFTCCLKTHDDTVKERIVSSLCNEETEAHVVTEPTFIKMMPKCQCAVLLKTSLDKLSFKKILLPGYREYLILSTVLMQRDL